MGKLEIGKEIKTSNPASIFQIDVKYMHGNADKYETEIVFVKDEGVVLEFVEALEEIITTADRERSCFAKKYPQFFDDLYIGDKKYNDVFLQWPGDCTCDGMYPSAVNDYNIHYFDEKSLKYKVNYVK